MPDLELQEDLECVDKLEAHLVIESIVRIRTIERNVGDVVFDFEKDGIVFSEQVGEPAFGCRIEFQAAHEATPFGQGSPPRRTPGPRQDTSPSIPVATRQGDLGWKRKDDKDNLGFFQSNVESS